MLKERALIAAALLAIAIAGWASFHAVVRVAEEVEATVHHPAEGGTKR